MKLAISTFILSLIVSVLSYAQTDHRKAQRGTQCPAEYVQNQEQETPQQRGEVKKKYPTREEILSQKIAFFTQELDLSPEEAQKFWPVYNEGWKKIHEAHKKVNKALKEINKAITAEPAASDKEIETMMKEYFNALKSEAQLQEDTYNAITKVLPVKKAAKTSTLEEKFRVMLIKQLRR